MYFKGLISDKGRPNDQKAFEYFKLAADQGYPKAYANLGIHMFILMLYSERNLLWKGNSRTKKPASSYRVHYLYETLVYTNHNRFYHTAAELHDVDGIFHLAYYTMEEASRSNDEEKYTEAADMFREALSIDPEYSEAYYYLGFLYENGI
jgi:TPR repeat protein